MEFGDASDLRAHYADVRSRLGMGPAVQAPREARPPIPAAPLEPAPLIPPAAPPVVRRGRLEPQATSVNFEPIGADLAPIERARRLVRRISASHGLKPGVIHSPSRLDEHVAARQEAMCAVAIACPTWSLPRIGRFFDRDHTTVLHALRKFGVPTPLEARASFVFLPDFVAGFRPWTLAEARPAAQPKRGA